MKKRTVQTAFIVLAAAVLLGVGSFFLIRFAFFEPLAPAGREENPEVVTAVPLEEEAEPAPPPVDEGTAGGESAAESASSGVDSTPPPVSPEVLEPAGGLAETTAAPEPAAVEPAAVSQPRTAPTTEDFSPPFLALISPEPEEFYHHSLRVEGRVSNSENDLHNWDQVKSVTWRFSGTSMTGPVEPAGRGSFTFLVPVAGLKGPQLLILSAEGSNGLTREVSVSLKEDLRPPVITLETPQPGDFFGDLVEVRGRLSHPSGSLSRLDSLNWFIPGGAAPADVAYSESGAFSFEFYPSGTSDTLTLQLSARTTRGASADLSVTLNDDGTGPGLTLTTGGEVSYVPGTSLEIAGRIDYPRHVSREKVFDSLSYRIFGTSRGGEIPVDQEGRFSLLLEDDLSGGEQVVELTALNNRGNPASRTVVLRPRREAPAAASAGTAAVVPVPRFLLPSEGSVTYASRLELRGRVTGASEGASVEWELAGTGRSGRQNLSSDGGFIVTAATDGLQGSQLLKLQISGPGGTGTASYLVRDDGTGPFLRIDSPKEGSVYRSLVEVTGQTADSPAALDSVREVEDLRWEIPGTSVGGRTEPDNTGKFSFSFSTLGLSETLVVKIIARDKNLRTTEKNLTLINDGVGPYLEITSPGQGSFYAAAPLQVEGVLGNRPDDRQNAGEVKSLSYRLSGSDQEERTIFFQEDGSFFFSVDMRQIKGPQILELNAESYTGNRTGVTLQLQDGTVPPEIRFFSPEPESPYGVGVWLTGRVVDPYRDTRNFGGIAEAVCRVTPVRFTSGEDTSLEQPLNLNADGSFRLGIPTVKMQGPQKVEVEVKARNGNQSTQSFTLHQGENAVPTLTVESRDREAFLDWDDMPGVLRYDLIYTADGTVPSSENGRRLSSVTPPVRVSGLTNGRVHSFLVRAETSGGPGESGVLQTVPLARNSMGLTARGEFGQIQLGWRSFPGLEGYRILRAREGEADFTDISGVIRGQSYIDTQVEYGRRYLYRVVPAGFEHIHGDAVAAESLSAPSVRVAEAHLVEGFTPVRVDVLGGYAYTAAGPEGFKIVDIGDPNNLQVVGELPGIPASRVRIRGDYAYLTDTEGGLQVVSILDPNNPVLLGSRPTAAGLDIIPYENFLFMADGDQGLKVFDVSQARRPVRKASLDDAPSYGLSLSGTTLYSAAGAGGLQIFDISQPDQPRLQGTYQHGPVYLSAVREDLGFVAGDTGWLEILDLKNQQKPAMISRIPLRDPRQLTALGDYLFVAAGGEGLKIYDITNPATPFLFDEAAGAEVTGLDVMDNRVYLADREGLRVIETYLKGESFVVSQGAPDSRPFHITLDDNKAYLSSRQRGVTVVDVSRPANLGGEALLSRTETVDAVLSVVWEDFLLVADGTGGLGVFGTTPGITEEGEELKLPLIARASLPLGATPAVSVAVSGGWAYFVSQDRGVYPVDLSALRSKSEGVEFEPAPLVSLPGARDVVADHDFLWVADRNEGLIRLSLDNPARPSVSARIDHPGARKTAVGEDRVFLIDSQGLHIYNRENLQKIGQYLTRFAENITVQGPYLYLSEGYRGLVVLDVSSPARPVKVSSCSTVYALGAAVQGNFAFLVDAESLKAVQVFIPEWLTR